MARHIGVEAGFAQQVHHHRAERGGVWVFRDGLGASPPAFCHRKRIPRHIEHPARHPFGFLAAEPHGSRRHPDRRHRQGGILVKSAAHERSGQASERARGQTINRHTVFHQFHRRDYAHGGDAGFGCAVVGLADVAVDARRRSGVDDASIVHLAGLRTLAPIDGGVVKRSESAFEVYFYHRVKVVLGEREDHAVAQDACVVDEDVYVAVGVYGLADHGLGLPEVAHIGPVHFGLPAGGSDFVHHFLCGRDVGACAVLVAAQVIDDDRRSVMSEHQSVLFADASPRTRDDCHLAFA